MPAYLSESRLTPAGLNFYYQDPPGLRSDREPVACYQRLRAHPRLPWLTAAPTRWRLIRYTRGGNAYRVLARKDS